jgi:L,D-transpeptidase YcbB
LAIRWSLFVSIIAGVTLPERRIEKDLGDVTAKQANDAAGTGSCFCKTLGSLAVMTLLVLCCAAAEAAEPDAPAALIGRTEAIRVAIQKHLSDKFLSTSAATEEHKALVEYYSAPGARLLWVDENGLSSRGRSAIEEIEKADDYGLRSSDYALPDAGGFNSSDAKAADWLAEAELKVSFAVLHYTRDARGGRFERVQLSPNLDPTLTLPDPLEVIESIALQSDPAPYLRSFQPKHPQFEALRQKLIELRGGKLLKANEAIQIPQIPDGPLLRFGVEHEQVALLRKRLDLPPGQNENLFDEVVQQAVMHFQYEHGSYPDGIVGPGTRRLLNPTHPRDSENPLSVTRVLVNMERWRWLPEDLGSFYVTVNVPEFMLRVIAEGNPLFTARVVVGAPDTQTPIFSQEMQEIVFNPYWSVPNSIKTEEILPYIQRTGGDSFFGGGSWNTNILQSHGLRISIAGREVDPSKLDWGRIDIRSLDIYQPPGPDNVLGNIKFLFPNKHDVYMHDTPQKLLFDRHVRAESHGCIRVQQPDQLALTLLNHDQGWNAAEVAAAIAKGYDQHVTLKQKIPVHITYFTLWVNDDGSISSFGDIYGHDARMAEALFGEKVVRDASSRANEISVGRSQDRNRAPRNGMTDSINSF